MQQTKGLQLMDFKKGRLSPNKVNPFTLSNVRDSCSKAINVDFDTRIGSVVPRKGCIELSSVVGLQHGSGTFKNAGGTIDVFFQCVGNTLRIWDGTAISQIIGEVHPTNKVRFATLGNRTFHVDGNPMKSSADGSTWTTDNCITGVKPTLVIRNKQHLLCAGDATYPDRLYFSSVINPTANPFITWNTTVFASALGGWIDINPDDGSNITSLNEVAGSLLVFKENSLYRVDSITKSVTGLNLFNDGTLSQETTTSCLGHVYFFAAQSGYIMRTNGEYPEIISRLAVQDYLDAITDRSKINLYSDNRCVYVSIGNVTVKGETYENVVLKYSVNDNSWTVYEYPRYVQDIKMYKNKLVGGATGSLVTLNETFLDYGQPIPFNFETQHLFISGINKTSLTQRIIYTTRYAATSEAYCILDGLSTETRKKDISIKLGKFVSSSTAPADTKFRTIAFGWSGSTNSGLGDSEPELLGITVEEFTDLGLEI